MKEEFTTAEVLKVTDIKKERLEVWIEKKFIRPSIPVGGGSGSRREWARGNIYDIELFKRLLGLGFNRNSADAFLKTFQRRGGGLIWGMAILSTPHSFLELKVTGKDISSEVRTEPTWEMDSSADQIIVINMRKLVDEVNAKINQLGD